MNTDKSDHQDTPVPPNVQSSKTTEMQSIREVSAKIGLYKLLQKLGEGGMGEVWMAEQEKPVRRRVALKLIKAGLDNRQVIARFEAERQALAMMDHPNIAKVLDMGTTESGQPFFVMELVQGIPFTKYCDRHKLSINERLELFIPVCKAVQHAHQKGIIHRDLKPSNVLVCLYDGKPVAKVIDFGLAKALQHQVKLTDKTMFTEFGQVVGTLQYMSPEQAEMNQLDIDTRTDVYSLGVMLYELLTGSTPIDADTLKQNAILYVLQTIREKEPPRPSHRLSSITNDAASGISDQRRIEVNKLKSILRGELDWIVMKALEKDRTRRYETASGFAEDIDRYLSNQPIVARPPNFTYRFSKFVQKYRRQVILASTILFILFLGLAGTITGFLVAWRQNALALASSESEREAMRKALNVFSRSVQAKYLRQRMGLEDFTPMAEVKFEVQYWGKEDLPKTSKEVRLTGHLAPVTSLAFDHDCKRVASGDIDGVTVLWNIAGNNPASRVYADTADPVMAVAFDRLKSYKVISIGRYTRGQNIREDLRLNLPALTAAAIGYDGQIAIAFAGENPGVEVWSPNFEKRDFQCSVQGQTVSCLSISKDGRTIAFATGKPNESGMIEVWKIDGSALKYQQAMPFAISSIAVDEYGKTVAYSTIDGTAGCISTDSVGQPKTLEIKDDFVSCVALSSDGELVASGTAEGRVLVFDSRSGVEVDGACALAGDLVSQIAFSSDARRIAAASINCRIVVAEVVKGRRKANVTHRVIPGKGTIDVRRRIEILEKTIK